MGYETTVIHEFSAAHRLVNYPGNCSNIHGHTWKVEVTVGGAELDELGMLIDFRLMKSILISVLSPFDHRLLNEVHPFNIINPTAENIAKFVFQQMQENFDKHQVIQVKVWESAITCAVYKGG